ncbi:MAG: glycoside hydrolase family 3 C-terminal domain-containing protein [Clostridia bacterium]|nr:glycoside hydrolase family 3 C-terminal domain-containing protein [Clostridia bacterium]
MYKNKNLPPKQRALDLLSKMTLDEKFEQMNIYLRVETAYKQFKEQGKLAERGCMFAEENTHSLEQFIQMQKYFVEKTRLGIPVLLACESLHGVIHENATVFPQSASLGCTFNRDLVSQMADIIGSESAALGVRQVYAPDLDIPRDPRWGRMQECYGEDPYLVGEMGCRYVKGVQSHPVATTLKHFIAYSTPENGINLAPVHIGEREMREVNLEPFKKCIDAGALSVMPAYNEVDGEVVHASKRLLRNLLRDELGFDGMTVSDYGAIDMFTFFHHIAKDRLEAGKLALEAGVDMEAPYPFGYGEELKAAVQRGEVDIKLIDECVLNILTLKFKVGLFENPYLFADEPLHTETAVELSRKADEEAIVMLKNDGILPLNKNTAGKIAVIGNNAKDSFLGDYIVRTKNCVDFYTGMVNYLGEEKVLYSRGCSPLFTDEQMIQDAIDTASKADTVFLVLGDNADVGGGIGGGFHSNNEITCSEGYDTHELCLPPAQQRLFDAISALNKPIVLVLYAGRAYALEKEVNCVNGFFYSFGGGEQSGNAFARLIFGEVSPSGKLSISLPKSTGHIPCYYNYKVCARGTFYRKPGSAENPGRDYVLASPNAWYTFGDGLSYTKVEYSNLSATVLRNNEVKVEVTLKNTGDYAINESVLLFLKVLYAPITPFVKRLRQFEKVYLNPGEEKTVQFTLGADDFTYIDINYKQAHLPGDYKVLIDNLECEFTIK